MLLASVADIRQSLGFDEMEDITYAITAALHSAEQTLTNALSTKFGRESRFDLYYLPTPGFTDGPLNTTEFRLRMGLVQSLTSVISAPSISALTTDPTTVSGCVLDADKGVVTDYETDYYRSFVKISYVAGFEADASDPTAYNLEQVPEWLQEVAKLQTLMLLKNSPPLTTAKVEIDYDLVQQTLRAALNQRVRYTPVAKIPL